MKDNDLFTLKHGNKAGVSADGGRYVGTQLPRYTFARVALWAVFRGRSKSAVLRDMLDMLIKAEDGVDSILSVLARRAVAEWGHRLQLHSGQDRWTTKSECRARFNEFREDIILRLKRQGLLDDWVIKLSDEITAKAPME